MFLSVLYNSPEAHADTVTTNQLILKYADAYQVSAVQIYNLAICESSLKETALNKADPHGGSKGILQFQQKTFDYYSDQIGIDNPDIWNKEQQIQVASYMFSIGEQNQWSCWKSVKKKLRLET